MSGPNKPATIQHVFSTMRSLPARATLRYIMRRTLWLAVFSAALCGQVGSGLAVGDRVPDFAAPDQAGRTQPLKSMMGPELNAEPGIKPRCVALGPPGVSAAARAMAVSRRMIR
jgi:hypothetical protein